MECNTGENLTLSLCRMKSLDVLKTKHRVGTPALPPQVMYLKQGNERE